MKPGEPDCRGFILALSIYASNNVIKLCLNNIIGGHFVKPRISVTRRQIVFVVF